MGMDYGKLDYVVVNGEAVLLDANKTIGTIAARRGRNRESSPPRWYIRRRDGPPGRTGACRVACEEL